MNPSWTHAFSLQPHMLLEAYNIGLRYGTEPVLRDVSFSLHQGKTYACVGPSGCGKTSLVHLLAGFIPLSVGEIQTNFTRAHPISVMLQQYGLFPWKRVQENIELGYTLLNPSAPFPTELVHKLGLEPSLHKWPRELSGGQQQRVALARALAQHPEILLLDEPFSALDCQTRESLQDLLKQLQQERGFTLLLVTHDMAEAAYLAEEIWIMPPSVEGVMQRYENPHMHSRDFRTSREYFDMCNTLRTQVRMDGVT